MNYRKDWLDPPYEKDRKSKNVKQLILIQVQKQIGEPHFT